MQIRFVSQSAKYVLRPSTVDVTLTIKFEKILNWNWAVPLQAIFLKTEDATRDNSNFF